MEFNEKLQTLRKKAGLTQEQLSEKLFISRTAVSKWESGRGFPNIQALQNISKIFGIPVDSLLSGDEILELAQKDNSLKTTQIMSLVFGLLDILIFSFIFLPLFGQQEHDFIRTVNLLQNRDLANLKPVYMFLFVSSGICGLASLLVRFSDTIKHHRISRICSFSVHTLVIIFSIMAREPYVNFFLFIILPIKVLILLGSTR